MGLTGLLQLHVFPCNAVFDPYRIELGRQLGGFLFERAADNGCFDFTGLGQAEQQGQKLGARLGDQHIEAIQHHQTQARRNGNGQPEININIKTENNTTNSSNSNAVGSDLPCKCRY